MELFERHTQLAELSRALDAASAGQGHLLFVGGEAGVGKTSLVRHFSSGTPETVAVFVGACDPLSTPRPLAPLLDMADALGRDVAQLLERSEDRPAIFRVFLDKLKKRATVVVFEDVHWADEATLDLLRYLARRAADTKALLIIT